MANSNPDAGVEAWRELRKTYLRVPPKENKIPDFMLYDQKTATSTNTQKWRVGVNLTYPQLYTKTPSQT